jgi:hypothetical protein
MLTIKPEAVCHVIFRDRQLQSGVPVETGNDDAWKPVSDPVGDAGLDLDLETLDPEPDQDSAEGELAAFITELPIDHQCELIALAWLGRGDSGKDDWDSLVELAQDRRNGRTDEYLLGMPMLSDYLEDALGQFDISCEDFENEHR